MDDNIITIDGIDYLVCEDGTLVELGRSSWGRSSWG